MTAKTLMSAALVAFFLAVAADRAAAQDYASRLTSFSEFGSFEDYNRGHNVSVLERERPEYNAVGIRAGAFEYYPRLETGLNYDDNVFATNGQKDSDVYLTVDPSINFNSDWSRNALDGGAGLNLRRYSDLTSENQDGYFARLNGRLSVVGDSYIQTGGSTQRLFEPRTSSGSPTTAVEPIRFDATAGYLRAVYQRGRTKASIGADYRKLNYEDGRTAAGGVVSQADRDRSVANFVGNAEYGITPDFSVFGRVIYSDSDYDLEGPQIASRDSQETGVMGGASFDLTALVRGAVGVGYSKRNYESAVYPDIDGLNLRAKVEYLPTPLTTLTAFAARSVEDSTIIGSGGYFATRGELRVDHELRRFILLHGDAGYEEDAFKGADRTDKIFDATIGGTYLVSSSVGLSADVVYVSRDSEGALAGRDYDSVGLRFSIVLQR
jgi:hypothetical protein